MMINISRRHFITAAAVLGTSMSIGKPVAWATASEGGFDFTKPLDGWTTVSGKWVVEEIADAAAGRALVQRATENEFNVIVAPGGPYGDVDVSVRFKPISGREDASAGIVFRFAEGRYYVIRANALEDNFNLYYYDRAAVRLTVQRSTRPGSAGGIGCGSPPKTIAFRPGSTTKNSSIDAIAASRPDASASGRRPTRSPPSMGLLSRRQAQVGGLGNGGLTCS